MIGNWQRTGQIHSLTPLLETRSTKTGSQTSTVLLVGTEANGSVRMGGFGLSGPTASSRLVVFYIIRNVHDSYLSSGMLLRKHHCHHVPGKTQHLPFLR
jgi:hypothetical protein